ncbi:MAG TPA: site-specific DNA-methyltransferase, partial [Fervidobacterium sp.]|nr:site-specific DNA-methyltransferase [Fervidobacterium sp.]
MSNTMSKYEVEFYNALEDIFIGEEIEGRSGYVNLMKIKSAYYRNVVKSQLQELIDSELTAKDIEDFREELFEKLYTFFKRYFSETGSIYYTYTPWSERVYERVYDPEKDVILFWKTHMLYYVKTEKNYKSAEIKIDTMNGGKSSFFFDVSEFEQQKANEKRDVVFKFKEIDSSGRVILAVKSSEK